MNAQIIPLQTLYLGAIVSVANDLALSAVQQHMNQEQTAGRLWLVAEGTTVPAGMIQYEFREDDVAIGVIDRNQRKDQAIVRYAEGLDGYLENLMKFFQAGRIANKTKSA